MSGDGLDGMYADAERARRYDTTAAVGNLALGGDRRIDRAVLRELALAPGERVIDVGAGTARLVPAILAQVRPGGSVVALDRSPVMVAEARRRGRLNGVEVEGLVGDATELPMADGSVDRVLFAWVLHELPPADRDAALREAARVVAPGGLVVVADHGPASNPLSRGWWRLVRRGLANPAERDSLAWHLEHPVDDGLAAAGLCVRRRRAFAGGLVRVVVAARPG